MSTDIVANFPNNSPTGTTGQGSAGQGNTAQSADLSTLSNVFAQAFQRSLTGSSGGSPNAAQEDAILDAVDSMQRAAAERKVEQRRADRNDFSRENLQRQDQNKLGQSARRQEGLESEYAERQDNRSELQEIHHQRESESLGLPVKGNETSNPPAREKVPLTPPLGTGNSANIGLASPPIFSATTFSTMVQPASASGNGISTTVSAAASGGGGGTSFVATSTGMLNPVSVLPSQNIVPQTPSSVAGNVSNSVPTSLQAAASVLTIFTASGRLGDDNDEEEPKTDEPGKKKDKRKQGTAFFGEALSRVFNAEVLTPLSGSLSGQQESRPAVRQIPMRQIHEALERPKDQSQEENTPEQKKNPTKPEMAELLRQMQPTNDILAEPPTATESQTEENASEHAFRIQLIRRITAACQSAAQQSAAQRSGGVRMKLHLDRHGELTLTMSLKQISVSRREMAVRFETESQEIARQLRENLDELRKALAEQGTELREVVFS